MEVASLIMSELTPVVSAQYGAFYLAEETSDGERDGCVARIAGYGVAQGPCRHGAVRAPARGWSARPPWSSKPILVEDVPRRLPHDRLRASARRRPRT